MVDIELWVYIIEVGGIDYHLSRKQSMSNMLITRLSECNVLYELEWFAKKYGFTISTLLDADIKVVLEKDFVNGAFL